MNFSEKSDETLISESAWTPAEHSKTVMASNLGNRGMMRPHHSRSPPFLVIGLSVVVIILGFNYWSLSSRNTSLAKELQEFQDKFRIAALKKMSTDRRNEQLVLKVQELELSAAKMKTAEDSKVQMYSKDISKKVADLAAMQDEVHKYKTQLLELNNTKQTDLKKEECPTVVCPTVNPSPTPLSVITVECADAMRQYRDQLLGLVDRLYGWRAANLMKKQVPEPPTSRPAGSIDITNKTKHAQFPANNIPNQQLNLSQQQLDERKQVDQHALVGNQVQQSGNQVQQSGNQVLQSGNQVLQRGNQVPQSGNMVPQSGNMVPQSGNQVPQSGNQLSPSGNKLSPSGNQLPQSGNPVQKGADQVPQNGNIESHGGNLAPQNDPNMQVQVPKLGGNVGLHGFDNVDEHGNPLRKDESAKDSKIFPGVVRSDADARKIPDSGVGSKAGYSVLTTSTLKADSLQGQGDVKRDIQLQAPLPLAKKDDSTDPRNPKPLGLGVKRLDDPSKLNQNAELHAVVVIEKPDAGTLADGKKTEGDTKLEAGDKFDLPKKPVLPDVVDTSLNKPAAKESDKVLTGHRSGPRDSLLKPADPKETDRLSAEQQKKAVDDLTRGGAAANANGYKGGDDIDSPDKVGGADAEKANNAQDKPIESKDHVDDALESPGVGGVKMDRLQGKSLDDAENAPHEVHAQDIDKDDKALFRPM